MRDNITYSFLKHERLLRKIERLETIVLRAKKLRRMQARFFRFRKHIPRDRWAASPALRDLKQRTHSAQLSLDIVLFPPEGEIE